MKPEEWLRLTTVIKVRNKLATWTRDDVVALANQEFGSSELTRQQVAELCEKLKHKRIEKPGKQFYLTNSVETGATPLEFKLIKNPGHVSWKETHWTYSNNHAVLLFSGVKDATHWAFSLVEQNPRQSWHETYKSWRQKTNLKNFSWNKVEDYPANSILRKVLNRRLSQDNTICTPLPDNADIKKQYWGLDVGDVLLKEDEVMKVIEVRSNLDTPPTITFKRASNSELD